MNSIAEDSQGNLWIGTSNGLNVFQKQKEKFFRINLVPDRNATSDTRDIINDLYYEKKLNILWVAPTNGLSKITLDDVELADYEKLSIKHYVNDPNDEHTIDNNSVTNIKEDSRGCIWAVTEGGYLNAYHLDIDKFERQLIDVPSGYNLGHLPKLIMIDADGDFWIGNDMSKLVVWDRDKNIFNHVSFSNDATPIFHMFQDSNDIIWIATDGFGIFLIDKSKGLIQHIEQSATDPFSLPNNQPSQILEDKDGIFWIATYNRGVSKMDLSKSSFGHYFHQPGNTNSLSTFIAQSILIDTQNRIWIGTDGGGLNLFDEKANLFNYFRSGAANSAAISSNKILYLTESHDHSIWVCTWDGGLNKFNPTTKTAKRYLHDTSNPYSIGQNTVWCAVEDSLRRLWLGTLTNGLNIFDPNTEKFYSYEHSKDDPTSVMSNLVFFNLIDSKNRLFVGTSLGLCYVNLSDLETYIPEKISFKVIKEKNLQGYRINYIFEDHLGHIWVGSDLGLHKLTNELSLIQSYSIKEGLPNNLILAITEDSKGFIWCTTKNGLSRLDPKTNIFKNFNVHDGLQGLEFQSKSIAQTKDGRILIGGINGFNLFDPEEIYVEDRKVKPLITKFRLNNRVVHVGDTVNNRVLLTKSISDISELELKYNESQISIEYVALHFENPERLQYSYKMIGLDDDYIDAGANRMANYSNIPPGEFIFEVKSYIDGDIESASGASFNIKVLPPPWKT